MIKLEGNELNKTCSHEHKKECLHSIVCSASCDHEQHERNGFSNSDFTNFVQDDIWDQVDCSIKEYLELEDTLF